MLKPKKTWQKKLEEKLEEMTREHKKREGKLLDCISDLNMELAKHKSNVVEHSDKDPGLEKEVEDIKVFTVWFLVICARV